MATLDIAKVSETAYLFWLDEGQPEGRDQEHWLRAIDTLSKPAAKAKPTRKAAAKPRAAGAATKKAAKPKAAAKKTTAAK